MQLLARLDEILARAGIESSGRESAWILETATGRTQADRLRGAGCIDGAAATRAIRLAERRAGGEPLQYVTGTTGWRRLVLAVGPGVFIPRPETELVAERAMSRLPEGGTIVDVGTGSGAIALSVADERPDATVLATDVSPEALRWARRNASALRLEVTLLGGDLFEGLPQPLRGRVDVIVSNPPYVAEEEREGLAPEVVGHEPHEALFAPGGGLGVLERLALEARAWLRRGGWIVLETGEGQGRRVSWLLRRAGYSEVSVLRDLTGRDRIVEGRA